MTPFLLNILVAVCWMLLWGQFDVHTFIAGFIIGYLLLGFISRIFGGKPYGRKIWDLIGFGLYFARILVQANWQMAKLVLSPVMPIHSRIVRFDVAELTPAQVTTFASAITLTPGTLAAEVSPDRRWLYVHCISAADRDDALRSLEELKRRLLAGVFS